MTKKWLLCGLVAMLSMCSISFAQAQGYPSRPIRILVGFGAGGGTDTVARLYAQKLSMVLNSPVVVENKPGAMQLLAAQPLLAAAPDGHTLWLATSSALIQTPGVRDDLPYDPLKSLTYIAQLAEVDGVFVVRQGLPIGSMRELISYAKANPGKLNYGSAGVGSGNHLLTEYIRLLTGTAMVHIPYKNDADVARELMAGTIDFAVVGSGSVMQFVEDGKLKPIGVAGVRRTKALPNVPTAAESGVDELKSLGAYVTYGLVGPAGMPASVVQTLNEALNRVARMPDVAQQFERLHFQPRTGTAADFRSETERELAIWRKVGKNLKLTPGGS